MTSVFCSAPSYATRSPSGATGHEVNRPELRTVLHGGWRRAGKETLRLDIPYTNTKAAAGRWAPNSAPTFDAPYLDGKTRSPLHLSDPAG